MGFLKRKTPPEAGDHNPVFDVKDHVAALRQRLHEDPEFTSRFVATMKSAREQAEQDALAESTTHAAAYGDTNEQVPRGIHVARAQAFEGLMHALNLLATDPSFEPADYTSQVRGIVGMLASEAYFVGQLETPPMLKQPGSFGYTDPEVGLVVVWDRVKNMGQVLGLDGLVQMPKPTDPLEP